MVCGKEAQHIQVPHQPISQSDCTTGRWNLWYKNVPDSQFPPQSEGWRVWPRFEDSRPTSQTLAADSSFQALAVCKNLELEICPGLRLLMTPSICQNLYYRQLCSDMFTTDIAVVKMKLLKYITFGHNIFLYKNYTKCTM